MKQQFSRTRQSIKNAKVTSLFYLIEIVLKFISRKIFIDYLGTEVLGLNTIATNLINFLSISELGIAYAISFSLYKPLYEDNKNEVSEIISLQGYLYRKIAIFISLSAIILMSFFPFFFKKADVLWWYPYATFLVLLTSSLLGYIYNYKQIILSANMMEYKAVYVIKGTQILKTILQIIGIKFFLYGYESWLLIELVFAIITTIILNKVITKTFPWLNTQVKAGKLYIEKYKQIITKTKQLFFHRIAEFALMQIGPLIMYQYLSLTIVSLYGNYQLLVIGASLLITNAFRGIGAAVGSLVAEGNQNNINSNFRELFISRFWIASLLALGIYYFAPSIISIWLGNEYLLPNSSLILITVISFILMVRTTVDNFIGAYGLYSDIYAPIFEFLINISLSLLLGYFWGLDGILAGVLTSLIVVVMLWKPYFLFSKAFKRSISEYLFLIIKPLLFNTIALAICEYLFPQVLDLNESFFNTASLRNILSYIVFAVTTTILYILFSSDMRKFLIRIKKLITKK